MLSFKQIFYLLLAINALGVVILFTVSNSDATSLSKLSLAVTTDQYLAEEPGIKAEEIPQQIKEAQNKLQQISQLLKEAQELTSSNLKASKAALHQSAKKPINSKTNKPVASSKKESKTQTASDLVNAAIKANPLFKPLVSIQGTKFTSRQENPFFLLGAYPVTKIPMAYTNLYEKSKIDVINYQLFNDDDYCERVDYYNLAHPENMFIQLQFFTDYGPDTVPRAIINKIGDNLMPQITKYGRASVLQRRVYHLDKKITSFFINMDNFHNYHIMGKHFLCATQMFNHIPGVRALIRKDLLVTSIDLYADKFRDKPQCFNKTMFFPYSHRLSNLSECEEFFEKINSQTYLDSLKTEPLQYLIKVGHGSHSADGVFLLDSEERDKINTKYQYGSLCGSQNEPLLAQEYIANPLLLDLHNKFDFRVYMLVASTNPLMVYYHDGFLRASLSAYDKFSPDRATHLTNTHLAESLFKEAKSKKINGMTEKELREYHIWSFEELQAYLLESGKINDEKWLENHLRPQFKQAIIHLMKMSSQFFWKGSNVYGLFGLDFMLDDEMNLWFIEGNPNPQLHGTSPFLKRLLDKLLRSLFEIEYGLYRSRMKRTIPVVRNFRRAQKSGEDIRSEWRPVYQKATLNRFEPEFRPSKFNTFRPVMDESLPGKDAYLGNIKFECILP